MQPETLDPAAVNLAKAIRQTESGGDFQAKGKSGEYGAYQFTEPTWNATAKKYGVNVSLEQATPEQQNEVAYKQIKEWKDAGNNVGQIASMWNAGEAHKDAYLDSSYTGVNKAGASYNVPAYAKSVATAYQKIKGGGYVGVDKDNPSSVANTQEPSLGQELTQRGTDIAGAVGQAGEGVGELAQGNIMKGAEDVGSGVLQSAGGVAGGIGDVVTKGLEKIPGVKSVEGLISEGVGKLANTAIGKDVISSVSNWAQAHPEAAKNLEAAGNIASIIPMFKAASLAVGLGKDALSIAMKSSLTKAAGNEIEGVAMKTIGGRALLSRTAAKGLDPIKTILESDALPEAEQDAGGIVRYNTKNAFGAMSTEPEEDQLQYALKSAPPTNGGQASIEASRKNALKAVAKEFEHRTDYDAALKEVNTIFDSYKNRFGDKVFLDKINELKRGVRKSVNFDSPKLQSDVHYIIGQSLMDDVEAGAKKLGIKGVEDLNKKMAAKIEAQKLLKLMNGRPVKVNGWGKWARKIKMGLGAGAGEAIGSSLGLPFAGTLAGGLLESGAAEPSTALTRLTRTGGLLPKTKSLAKTAGLLPLRQGAKKGQGQ